MCVSNRQKEEGNFPYGILGKATPREEVTTAQLASGGCIEFAMWTRREKKAFQEG